MDGVGREVAEYVSRHFPQELLKNTDYLGGRYEKALVDTFLKMDVIMQTEPGRAEISKLIKESEATTTSSPSKRLLADPEEGEPGPDTKGCTSNVILIKNHTLYIANAGDSRSVLASKGRATELSKDHKPDNEIELRRINKAGGAVVEGRVDGNLNLSRALGDLRYKTNKALKPQEQMISAEPDVRVEPINPDCDFVVMGCDGVYETKTSQQIVDFIYEQLKASPPRTAVEHLLDTIISPDYIKTEGAGCDNMTCILIKFKSTRSAK